MTKTYYRLLCLQGTGYMATGYNTNTYEELAEAYGSYKSNDWDYDDKDNEDEEGMMTIWNKMTLKEKIDFIRNDEFEIEQSTLPFNEDDIH